MSKIFPIRSQRSNEELFFDYHPQLLKWALQLAHLDRDDAEDLVQDFYLQITHINVVLAEVDAIEPYLFKILRNLHYSRLRRQGKHSQQELSIVDFDSLERGLAAVDRNGLLLVRANLTRICDFACQRKGRSRAACVFILRFFMGYYSSEVMKIASMSRMGVDRALQVARSEARRHLNVASAKSTTALSAPQASRGARWSSEDLDDSHTLFLKLRQSIFNSCEGRCFEAAVLEEHYAAEPTPRFTARELAHLVTCKFCLDQVNTILGLPPLDERSLDGSIGRDNPPGAGSGQGPGFTITAGKKPDENARRRKVLERRMREFFEHRPESLEVAINGETRTTQRVTAEVSQLELKLSRAEEPGFIEVFSEQGMRLAYLHVAEPTSSPDLEQHEHVELSDGRSLDLRLSFANDLSTVQVVYRDPVFAQALHAEDEEDAKLLRSSEEGSPFLETLPTFRPQATYLSRLFVFCNQCLDLVRPRMNPLLASAMLLALSSIICFLLWTRSGFQIPAAMLLARAEQSDASVIQSARTQVIYQKVRMTASGRAVERAIYRDPQKKRQIKQQHNTVEDQWLKDKLNRAGVDWDEPLSAANYSQWRDGLTVKQDVVARTGYNLLTLTTSTATNGLVARESLTVRESDFHPVERTIELRDVGSVEIAELTYDVMPWGAVNQDWFEPLAGQGAARPPAIHPPLHVPHLLSELELDEAELAARTTLNQLHADTGEPIHLTRAATGIDIKGVVDTNTRKQEILSHLVLLSNVHSSLLSAEEIGTRPQSRSGFGNEQPLQVYSVDAQPSPLERYLREKNLGVDQLASVSHNLLDQGLRISQAGVHYFELQPRYQEADQLPADQQTQLATLSRAYLGTIQAGLDANRQTLVSLGFKNTNQAAALPELGIPEVSVDEQIRRYRQLCLELISNGTDASRPAAAIAEELVNTGDRIRLRLVTASVNVAKDSN
jgi:DNA-directed RNA polymerase specialized sigma24 family protein